jgi:pyridoxine 5-phosphate synthase
MPSMTHLSVNVNKIALLRNSRGSEAGPNLLAHAQQIVGYGAQGITVHPRADRRHITPEDARDIATHIKSVETNFEGDVREEFLDMVLTLRPTQCTLVPVSPGEITSHRGWEVARWAFLLRPVIARIKEAGVRVSVFIGAEPDQARAAADVGADRIEIYTAPYAFAFDRGEPGPELEAAARTAEAAARGGLGVNAGHDLTHHNLPAFVRAVEPLHEVSIGHYLVTHALTVGLRQSVADYLRACRGEDPA